MKTVLFCALVFIASLLSLKAETPSTPDGLALGDWSSIRAAHTAWKHTFRLADDGTHAASNPGQGWSMTFDGSGFTVRPREGGWSWGLELEAPVSGPASAEGQRLSVPRGEGLEEWFVNDTRGLEQGWTFHQRPEGDEGVLRLSLKVRGGLEPEGTGRIVSFGGGTLNYGGLKAWDATGRDLDARFSVEDGRVIVEVEAEGAVYPVTVDPVAQQAYLKASNVEAADEFGSAVAIEGNTVVVGAPYEAGDGIGGPGDNNAPGAGAAYVFVRDAQGAWTQQAYLKASNAEADDGFGSSVAISGAVVAVGAPYENGDGTHGPADNSAADAGAVYTFRFGGGNWEAQSYIKASNADAGDQFGSSVSISGGTLVVGAPREDGNGADGPGNNGTNDAGAAYVFEFDTGSDWDQTGYLKDALPDTNEFFGESVAIEGDLLICGIPRKDGVGAAIAFRRVVTAWEAEATLKASNAGSVDRFGSAVALSGSTALIGASLEDGNLVGGPEDNSSDNSGAAYVFVRGDSGEWSQQAYLKASNVGVSDHFGQSVAISGAVAVVGAGSEAGDGSDPEDDSMVFAGAAYVFVRNSLGQWRQQAYLKASNSGADDSFGSAVAVSGGTALIGAPFESGDGSDEADNSALSAGAAYVFVGLGPLPPNLTLTKPTRFNTTRRGKRSKPQTVRVDNTGDITVVGIAVRLLGKARRDFRYTRPASTVVPGGKTVLRVSFRPTAKGMRRATLSVSSVNADVRRVPLMGRGTLPRRGK